MPSKINKEDFEKRLNEMYNGKFTLVNYTNYGTPCEIKHTKCGNIFTIRPINIIDRIHEDKCKHCGLSNAIGKKTLEQFKNDVKEKFGDDYTILGNEYINNKTKILTRHNLCNTEFMISPNSLLYNKNPCPNCCYKLRKSPNIKTTESFKREVKEIDPDYEFLGEYINNKYKSLFKHLTCGNEFEMRPNDFQQGYRCPHCSKGTNKKVNLIEKIFESNNIEYIKEQSFEGCSYKRSLKFDYYLPDYRLLIEIDGVGHYKNIHNENFNTDQIIRDWIKNYWCREHDVKLLRIYSRFSDNVFTEIVESFLLYNDFTLLDEKYYYYDNNEIIYNEKKYYLNNFDMNYLIDFQNYIEQAKRYYYKV